MARITPRSGEPAARKLPQTIPGRCTMSISGTVEAATPVTQAGSARDRCRTEKKPARPDRSDPKVSHTWKLCEGRPVRAGRAGAHGQHASGEPCRAQHDRDAPGPREGRSRRQLATSPIQVPKGCADEVWRCSTPSSPGRNGLARFPGWAQRSPDQRRRPEIGAVRRPDTKRAKTRRLNMICDGRHGRTRS